MAAKRARQINAYYSQLGEGLLEYVGPLVETRVQEKPLSIALREISERLLQRRAPSRADGGVRFHVCPRHPRRRRGHRRLQGVRAAPAAHRVRASGPGRADPGRAPVRRRGHLGRAVRPAGDHRRVDRRARGAARPDRARTPTWSWSRPPPPTCWPGPPPGMAGRPADRHPAHRALPGACTPRPCTPRCGSTRPPRPTWRTLRAPRRHRPRARGRPPDRRGQRSRAGCRTRPRSSRAATRLLARGATGLAADLAGRRVVVSAGGTREELDPVRFLGNWSSGTAGLRAGQHGGGPRRRGDRWWRPTWRWPTRPGAKVIRVVSAREMHDGGAGRGAGRGRGRDGRRGRRLPAGGAQRGEDQEGRQPPEPLRLIEMTQTSWPLPAPEAGSRPSARDPERAGLGPRLPSDSVGFAAETDTSSEQARAKLAAQGL